MVYNDYKWKYGGWEGLISLGLSRWTDKRYQARL